MLQRLAVPGGAEASDQTADVLQFFTSTEKLTHVWIPPWLRNLPPPGAKTGGPLEQVRTCLASKAIKAGAAVAPDTRRRR